MNEYGLEDRVGKNLWVVKVYHMVGVGLNMITYFRGVTGLMLLYAFDEVFAGLTNTEGSTRTNKAEYYVGSFEVTLGNENSP